MGPRAGLDGCKKFRPPLGFDPQTVQPVAMALHPNSGPGRLIFQVYRSPHTTPHTHTHITHTHIHTHTHTDGRTPLDERAARRRIRYLHNKHKR